MKRIFTIFLTLFVASSVWAVKIDGINYRYDSQTNTCSVVSGDYSGDIVIPATVTGVTPSFSTQIVTLDESSRFYTFDKGPQTIDELDAVATNVLFQVIYKDEALAIISGTESPNEIVKAQASETIFVHVDYDNADTDFESVDWSKGTTIADRLFKLGGGAIAFKNVRGEGVIKAREASLLDDHYFRIVLEINLYNGKLFFEDASVTSIESGAFSNCIELNSVAIPNSVSSIGREAFYGCEGLTSITIPNSVTSINELTFYGCTNLASIIIPNNVTSIAYHAFKNCTKLAKVTCLAITPPDVTVGKENDNDPFSNYNGYLYIPCDNKEDYEIDVCWGSFKHVECIGAEPVELTKDEVAVVPEKTEAVFSMPKNESANSYTLTISNNGVTFCTLTFNAQGQLANIDFSTNKSYELKSGVEAFQFTVTGLSTAEDYGYSFKALASNKSVLKEYSGSFTTKNEDGTGGSVQGGGEGSGQGSQGGSTAVSEVSNATAVTVVNGQILVNGEAPAFVVTVSGKKTANANLKAGVYFVVADGNSMSVVVR
ncbi:MAG: leucine-rich repeat domain-containing protein [Bacteroidales bacterium]|nr:leucine-rich repeat domain-containing protein [Bacteroidales bacterium]